MSRQVSFSFGAILGFGCGLGEIEGIATFSIKTHFNSLPQYSIADKPFFVWLYAGLGFNYCIFSKNNWDPELPFSFWTCI
jgi:hypothetical protein